VDQPTFPATTKTRIKLLLSKWATSPISTAKACVPAGRKLFGLVISSMTNPIYSRVVLAIEEKAHLLGYDVLLAHTLNIPSAKKPACGACWRGGWDGLFISPVYRLATEARIYQELLARRVPDGSVGSYCTVSAPSLSM